MKLSEKANDKVNERICNIEEELDEAKKARVIILLTQLLLALPPLVVLTFYAVMLPSLGTILPIGILSSLLLISEKFEYNALSETVNRCKQELKHLENMQKDGIKIDSDTYKKKKEKRAELSKKITKMSSRDLKIFKASYYLEALAAFGVFVATIIEASPLALLPFGALGLVKVALDATLASKRKQTENYENRVDNLKHDIEVSNIMREEKKNKELVSKVETVLDQSKYNIEIPKEIEEYIERLAREQEESKPKEFVK